MGGASRRVGTGAVSDDVREGVGALEGGGVASYAGGPGEFECIEEAVGLRTKLALPLPPRKFILPISVVIAPW